MPLADLQSLLARALMDRSFRETVLQCTPADAPPEWKQIAGIPATELHRIAYYTLGLRAVTLQRILPKTWQFLPPRFSPVWMERYMAKHPSTTTDGLSGLSEVRRFVEFLSSCHERGEISSAALNSARLEGRAFALSVNASYWATVPRTADTIPASHKGLQLHLSPHVNLLPRDGDLSSEYLLFGDIGSKRLRSLLVPRRWTEWLRTLPAAPPAGGAIPWRELIAAGVVRVSQERGTQ
jgi:hypothetical protein